MDRQDEVRCCGSTFWIYVMVVMGLLLLSGLMSGLTLGLMSLGEVDLEVIRISGKPKDRYYASKIVPVVKRRHLLLVTLLVGNAVAMEALPLFLDSLVGTWISIALSVTLLLMFGEIIPQAVCTRYGLRIGATLAPFVKVLLVILFPIAWPVSKLLDYLLGSKHGGLFGRAQLKTLVDMHGNEAGKGGELSVHETKFISSALELAGKTAKSVMTPINKVVSVEVRRLTESKTDPSMLMKVFSSGYSRIPVYMSKPNNLIGVLVSKNFPHITFEKSTNMPMLEMPIAKLFRVSEDTSLYEILDAFQMSRNRSLSKTQIGMVAVVRLSSQPKGFQPNTAIPKDLHCPLEAIAEPKELQGLVAPRVLPTDDTKGSNGHRSNSDAGGEKLKKSARSLGPWTDEEGEIVGILTREDVLDALLSGTNLHETKLQISPEESTEFDATKVANLEPPQSNLPSSLPSTRHLLRIPRYGGPGVVSASGMSSKFQVPMANFTGPDSATLPVVSPFLPSSFRSRSFSAFSFNRRNKCSDEPATESSITPLPLTSAPGSPTQEPRSNDFS